MDILEDIFFDILLVYKDIVYNRYFVLRSVDKYLYIYCCNYMVCLKGNFVYKFY